MSEIMHRHQFHAAATSKDMPGNGAASVANARYWQIAALWFADLNIRCTARYSVRNGTASKTVSEVNRPVRVRSGQVGSAQLI